MMETGTYLFRANARICWVAWVAERWIAGAAATASLADLQADEALAILSVLVWMERNRKHDSDET